MTYIPDASHGDRLDNEPEHRATQTRSSAPAARPPVSRIVARIFEKLLTDLEALRPVQTKIDREVATQEARVWSGDDVLNVHLDETKKEDLVEIGTD